MNNSHYFDSRTTVGQDFAKKLEEFRYENTAVLALSPGGVVIAVEIAKALHSLAGLLLLKHIYLPGEPKALGVINDQGHFTYDESIAAAQIEDFEMEYRGHLEQQKMNAIHELHTVGHSGVMNPHYFSGRTIIIVNDITKTGTAYRAAINFLKPIKVEKIVLVSAISHVQAIDTMHLMGDKLLINHVTDKDFPPEHYFKDNSIPDTKEIMQLMEQIVLQW